MNFRKVIICLLMAISVIATKRLLAQTIITDGSWKGVGNSIQSNGTAWLFQGYDDSAWPAVEAPNVGNTIPVVAGSQSIWVLPYSDTAKMRKTFVVPVGDSYSGSISINADNEFELYFNGVSQGFYNNWMGGPYVFNISPVLQGCVQNVIAINAANWGGPYGASLNTTLFVTNPLNTPVATAATNVTCSSFMANWDSVPTANLYLLDVSDDPNFGTFYSIYHDYNVGNSLSQTLSSLPPWSTFYYRLRCQRISGIDTLTSCYSNTIQVDLDSITYTYSAPDTLCAGEIINLQLSSAAGSSYSWSGPNGFFSTDSIAWITNASALNAGEYIYTVSFPGCPSISDTIEIEIITNPAFTITPAGPYCTSFSFDTLVASIAGVQWSGVGITNPSVGIFDPAIAGGGNHLITCISGGYCPDTATSWIVVTDDLGYLSSGPDTLCAGSTLTLWLTANSNATYSWSGPNGFTSIDSLNYIINTSVLHAGPYIYTINYPGCPAIVDTIQIDVIDNPPLIISPSGPYCSSEPLDTFIANNAPVQWSGTGIMNVNLGTFSPGAAGGGSHTITCILGGYCPDTSTFLVTVNVDGGYTISGSDTVCEGQNILLQSTSGAGATIGWIGPNSYSSANNNNTITQSTSMNSGLYILTVSYPSCPPTQDTLAVAVISYPNPVISAAGPFCDSDPAQVLSASPAGGAWFGNGVVDSQLGSFDPMLAGLGTHNIYYVFSGNCPNADTISILVANSIPLSSVIFPNVFTPNSDNQNDVYQPIVPASGHFRLDIFDRWGVLVFSSSQDIGWNGSIDNSSANEGIYYWICEITSDCSAEPLIEKGFLQLFKP